MPGLCVDQIDHVELFVPDRRAAADWYSRTLGLTVVAEFEHWADDPNGPLMMATCRAGTKLAFFSGPSQGGRPTAGFHRIAFRVGRNEFDAFLTHLKNNLVFNEKGVEVDELIIRDHGAAHSVYFFDPYGHRLEITTYDVN